MDAKMESLELEDNGGHQSSLEASLVSDVIYDDSPVCPCIGSEHQAEIPNLATEDERRQYMTSSLDSCMVHGYDHSVSIGSAIPIMWAPSSEFNKKEGELQMQHSSETDARASSRDGESQVTSILTTSNNTSGCDSTYQDPHPVAPLDKVECDSHQAHDDKLAPCSTREGLNFTSEPMIKQGEIEQFAPLPNSSTSFWSDLEAECFLLGLYIFGKNLSLVSRFLGTKTVGDVLCYYYGKFYKGEAYKRWSDCRKARTRRCILGEHIFTGWRQQELILHLKSKIIKDVHDSLDEVFKSFSDSQTSLQDFVFALRSTVGTEAFVEAVGIGKGKHDLTGFVLDPSKPNQVLSVHPDMPIGKDCSSLASEDIIKFLTGDFRRSKTRSNDLFWEAVWPRLLARGWHSEQPKDVSTTKNCLVFLVPGIKRFSRSKLTKGTHYFDSVSDVLKKVAADPFLLELDVDGMGNTIIAENNGCGTDMKLNQDIPLEGYQELPKFTIIDTSLVQGEEPFTVRELRNLPADANISFVASRRSHDVVSVSSSEEQDADDRSSDDQEDSGRVTADMNGIEIVSAYNAGKKPQVDSSQNIVTASCSVFPANGHSSDGNGDTIDLTRFFGQETKTERRKYLSPVSKRRRLANCSNDLTSRRSFSFSKVGGLDREKIKLPSTSAKPTVVDVDGTFQTKTIASCSRKEKPCVQIKNASNSGTKDWSNEKMDVVKLNEEKSFECKEDAVTEVHSKITSDETKIVKEGAQASSLNNEAPEDGKASLSACIPSSDNRGCTKTEEALSISNSEMVRDIPEAGGGGPVSAQPDQALPVNSRRHGTRNRPPTARALEAVAFGLLGGGKRKGDPKSPGTSRRPPKQTRKSTKDAASMSTSSDTEKSSMESEVR